MRFLKPTLLTLLLAIVACTSYNSAEEIWKATQSAIAGRDYIKSIKLLTMLVEDYPDDPLAPQAQMKIGEIYMNNTHELEKSLAAYQVAADNYADNEAGVKALFMIGFVNANYLQDIEAARKAYSAFIEKYPNHELVPSVQFELDNLGKPLDEINVMTGEMYNGE